MQFKIQLKIGIEIQLKTGIEIQLEIQIRIPFKINSHFNSINLQIQRVRSGTVGKVSDYC